VNKLILYIFFLAAGCSFSHAQETMYVPQGSNIFFGNTNEVGIFGYVRNNGNISLDKNAQINFLGKIWMNETSAEITDKTTTQNSINGGTINFVQNNPVYGNVGQQIFNTGFTDSTNSGPTFSNITIDNNAGVIITSDLNVLNNLQFKRGHLFLNKYNVVMGDTVNTGSMKGYDERRYIVTGQGAFNGYVKYRSVNSGLKAAFPVGPTVKNYSPLEILNRGQKDEFYARAFDSVFTHAITGPLESDSTLQLTWVVGKKDVSNSDVVVTLQNDMSAEDPVFKSNREKSYVSLYGRLGWDKPYFLANGKTRGDITTSFPTSTGLMNSRTLTVSNQPLYLTKKVTYGRKTFFIPNVFSPNGDNINDTWNIRALKDFANCTVEIFNRWGQPIFRSNGYQQPWDGTYNGKPLAVATYYYIIDVKDGQKPIAGSVTILR
jgi:gliding motility-associated-like protein